MGAGGDSKIFVGDLFQLVIGRVKHDLVDALPPLIKLHQFGHLAVGRLRQLIHLLRRDGSQRFQRLLSLLKMLR